MSQNPSIIIIGPAHPLRGGLAAFDERLAREFNKLGYRTIIYTFSYQYPGFLFPGKTQYSSAPAPTDLNIRVKINSVNPLNWLRIGNEIRNQCPDIVMARFWLPFMGPCLGTILRQIKKNKHSEIVCLVDNIIPHEKRPGDAALTRYFIKPVDRFVTMSDNVQKDLRQFTTTKPVINIPHPLYDHFGDIVPKDEARRLLGINESDPVMLFFGFIRKYKGLDILLNAMKMVVKKPQFTNLKLMIAGEFYDDKKNYSEWLDDPVLAPHLILHTEFIADDRVRYFLSAADCTIQPYRSATQSGVTPLSYHFEVPMIVTNVGGLPDMVPDMKVGLVAEPNAEDLADKIERYFSLGQDFFLPGLREEKKNYSWKRMADAIAGGTENEN